MKKIEEKTNGVGRKKKWRLGTMKQMKKKKKKKENDKGEHVKEKKKKVMKN